MEFSNQLCEQIIRTAYDIQTNARPLIAQLHQADIAAHLISMEISYPKEPEPSPGHFLDRLDHPYWQAAEVAKDAHRLGVGVLIGDYLLRRTRGELSLICRPLDTTFKRTANRAMNAMLKRWTDHTEARAVPELHAAYLKLDAMLDVLADMMRDDQRKAMRLEINPQATNLKVASVIKVERLRAA
jgi:hypothetical protein